MKNFLKKAAIIAAVILCNSQSANAQYQSGIAKPTAASVTTIPGAFSSTNSSSSITTGGTFQLLLAQNVNRKGCLLENPTTATEVLYVYVYSGTTGTPSINNSFSIPAGGTFSCGVGGYGILTDQLAIEAPTTGHTFVFVSQ